MLRLIPYKTSIAALLAGMVLALTGCNTETEIPDDVLSIEEMTPILKDLQIAYAGVDQTIRKGSDRVPKYQEMNRLVMEKHQVEPEQFFKSYQFYLQEPALIDTIYQKVITQLNKELLPLQNQQKASGKAGLPEAK